MESFRLRLREIKLDNLKTSDDLNLAYNEFQRLFSQGENKSESSNFFQIMDNRKALQRLPIENKNYTKNI